MHANDPRFQRTIFSGYATTNHENLFGILHSNLAVGQETTPSKHDPHTSYLAKIILNGHLLHQSVHNVEVFPTTP